MGNGKCKSHSGASFSKCGIQLTVIDRQPPISLPTPPFDLSPLHQTHTVTPSFRGINGDFTHWREALAPKPPAHPTLSSSTTRAPGSLQNFVRGKGSYAPFLPGGLEAAAKVEEDEGEDEDEDEEVGWKTRAPGMKRGAKLDGGQIIPLKTKCRC